MTKSILIEAISKFLDDSNVTFSPTLGGVNNIVVKATFANESSYILRVYNNGHDSNKVQFEHLILQMLSPMNLSFSIPKPIISLCGKFHVPLSDGSEASLFHVIPGNLPRLTAAYEIGKACGELTKALSDITTDDNVPPTPPYYEIYKVHHSANRETFLQELNSNSFDSVRESATFAEREILQIESLITTLLDKNLPQQLIHGDLHYDNVLVLDGVVTGVLDFEFCAMDWRAIDLAICLSKYVSESNPLEYFRDVISGYVKHVTLTQTEIEVLPDLGILRILSNIVYFVARALSGEDSISTLTERLDTYVKRIKWLRTHRQEIINCFANSDHQ